MSACPRFVARREPHDMINRVSRKDPRFLTKPSGLCPCGSGKILAQCCRRFDGVVFKEPSAIRPPGPPTGYSHPRCYLGFTQNCCSKISGEHFVSQGILRQIGQSVSVGAPWLKTGEIKTFATKNLTANMLCVHHNSAFSHVDTAAIRLFAYITEINADLAQEEEQFIGEETADGEAQRPDVPSPLRLGIAPEILYCKQAGDTEPDANQ